ncbi:MAG: high-potential iron-sulfur protein [Steroidobacteraceae bacterium]
MKVSRRAVLSGIGLLATLIAPRRAPAAIKPGPLLDEKEPAARNIGYVANAREVDLKANPGYKRSQTCATCAFIAFGTARQRACSLVGNRLVESAGWCKVWKLRGSR